MTMFQIGNTLVSIDLAERFFCCDLTRCKGRCCFDGDSGAPITEDEERRIREVLPLVWNDLLPGAKRAIEEDGISYVDVEHDLVTQLVEGGSCVFATLAADGTWICALEKACREGRTTFLKPLSCHLYPVRIKEHDTFTAVNYDSWKICGAAEVLGRAKGIRAYMFLEEPLRRRFGDEWYDELELTCNEYIKQYCTDTAHRED